MEENFQEFVLEKIKKFESALITITSQLNGEILSRQKFQEECYKLNKDLSTQMNILRNTFKSYDSDIKKSFDKMHNEITKDMNCKNNSIMEFIKENINNEIPKEKQEDNNFNFNIEKFKTNNSCLKEFKEYRTEIANLFSKINLIELNFENKLKKNDEEIITFKKDINFMKSSIDELLSNNDKILNNINNLRDNFKEKHKQIDDTLNNITNSELLKDRNLIEQIMREQKINSQEIEEKLTEGLGKIISMDHNLNNKLRMLKESLNTQFNNQNKEIDNFEVLLLTENDKFKAGIVSTLEQNLFQIKSVLDFTNNDVDLLRNKSDYTENSLIKLRNDIYVEIRNTEEFLLQKIHKNPSCRCVNNTN